MLIPCLYWES